MGHARNVRDAFGFLTPGEFDLLEGLTKELPEYPVVVNFGAGAGTSGLLFIESRPDLILYTIDIQDASSPHGSLEGERNAFRDAGLLHLLNHRWYQIHGDSRKVGIDWQHKDKDNPMVDLVFVDGDHSYAGCAGDIRAWMPNLRPGGIMVIHDFDKAANDPTEFGRKHAYPGVDKAVRELLLYSTHQVVGQADCTIALRKVA